MTTPSIDLIWISVADLQKAVKFYSEVVGLKVLEMHEDEHMGWAELGNAKGGGALLGIARHGHHSPVPAGGNAVITLTVPDLDLASSDMKKKGAKIVGEVQEVPGHVKMQLFIDQDGNHCQLVQNLGAKPIS